MDGCGVSFQEMGLDDRILKVGTSSWHVFTADVLFLSALVGSLTWLGDPNPHTSEYDQQHGDHTPHLLSAGERNSLDFGRERCSCTCKDRLRKDSSVSASQKCL